MVVLERRNRPGVVDKIGVPLTMRTPALLAVYAFRGMTGSPAVGDPIPDTAPVLDTAPACTVGDDGMLRMLMLDGSMIVAGRARGADAVLPASMVGFAKTGQDGRAALDWSALKLKAVPSWVDVSILGKPMPWAFDADWGLAGVTVSVVAEKPAVGVRLAWRAIA